MGYLAALLAAFVIGLPVGILLLLGGQEDCSQGAAGPAPSGEAEQGIPANYLRLYQAAGEEYGVPWNLLAGIGSVETDHGRLKAPGVTSGANTFGCCGGPMQFYFVPFGGRLDADETNSSTWGRMAVDGNDDGRKVVWDPEDAIPSAARYLRASGAPEDLESAIFAYNRAGWYVQKVLGRMRAYGSADTESLAASDNTAGGGGGGCEDLGGLASGDREGNVTIDPAANAAGRPLSDDMTAFLRRMGSFYEGELVVTTGTNHSTQSLSGNTSDHASGNGVDMGMVKNGGTDDGPVGDAIAAAAFLAAGLPRDEAIKRGRAGGAQTVVVDGIRIQVIWKSDVGGNHHNHVHVGLKPTG